MITAIYMNPLRVFTSKQHTLICFHCVYLIDILIEKTRFERRDVSYYQ